MRGLKSGEREIERRGEGLKPRPDRLSDVRRTDGVAWYGSPFCKIGRNGNFRAVPLSVSAILCGGSACKFRTTTDRFDDCGTAGRVTDDGGCGAPVRAPGWCLGRRFISLPRSEGPKRRRTSLEAIPQTCPELCDRENNIGVKSAFNCIGIFESSTPSLSLSPLNNNILVDWFGFLSVCPRPSPAPSRRAPPTNSLIAGLQLERETTEEQEEKYFRDFWEASRASLLRLELTDSPRPP